MFKQKTGSDTSKNYRRLGTRIWKNRQTYILLSFGLAYYVIFAYLPMGGLILAFKDFKGSVGILRSPWVGLKHFEYVFTDREFFRSIANTFIISIQRTFITFPIPIIIALLLNEISKMTMKRVFQTVFTFPHFLSWVIVASIMVNVLGNDGLVNGIIHSLGGERIQFLAIKPLFRPLLYITGVWKSAGWSAIIYMAVIASIEVEQYESATIDGATRLQKMLHITLPGMMSIIMLMLVLSVGSLMTSNFDQIFNLGNPLVREVAETLDVYIYRITFQSRPDFSFSTAISLFRSIVNFSLLMIADRLAR